MKIRIIGIAALAVAVIAAGTTLPAPTADASQGAPTTIGVYRWDAWHGDPSDIYDQVLPAMEPAEYADKLPFYTDFHPDGSIDIDDTDAAWKMEQEIDYAADAGVDYWAFLHYSESDPYHLPMNDSFKAYLAASNKADIGFTFILSHDLSEGYASYWSTAQAYIVTQMADPQWQRVLGDRPLLYVLKDARSGSWVSRVASLRTAATTAGLANPYIVAIDFDPATGGLDARTGWTPIPTTAGAAYSTYAAQVAAQNSSLLSGAPKSVMTAHVNWDSRPYHDNPPSWYPTAPDLWAVTPTASEYAAVVQNAINLTQDYPDRNEANTVFVYAWNEFTEGGIMVPTLEADGLTINTDILDGLASTNRTGTTTLPASKSLGLGRASYSSSSQRNTLEVASRAFDDGQWTDWQGSSAPGYANQWLQVDFGASLTVDGASIREYGNRTSGYRIEYWNGTAWATAYTGTTIGALKTVTFPAVTTTKMRLYFTGGISAPLIYDFAPTGTGQNLALGRTTYTASSQWNAAQSAAKAFDGSSLTNWQSASGQPFAGQWLEADLGAFLSVNSATISEYGTRTTGYRIEYWNGSGWSTAYTGTTIGASTTVSFPAVTARRVRIYFTSGSATPIVYEFAIK